MEIRLNIFDENNKWVGQEYLTEKGKWLHRWTLKGELEKGSWRGRAKGDNELNWRYERVVEECSGVLKANELLPHVSHCACSTDERTGTTAIQCCNVCGKPTEDWWRCG